MRSVKAAHKAISLPVKARGFRPAILRMVMVKQVGPTLRSDCHESSTTSVFLESGLVYYVANGS